MPKIDEIRNTLLKKTREQVRERFGEKDLHIIRAVNSLDELDRVFNQLAEQIIEWYSAHFPELARTLNDNEKYLETVSELGERKNYSINSLEKILKNPEKAAVVEKKAQSSMGAELGKENLQAIQELCKSTLSLREQRNKLSQFIEKETMELLPNFSKISGKLLAGRMLKAAGSFRKLAFSPSSTIQILGAEKALFRHKRTGARPPKYGLLFQHPEVQAAIPKEKGKKARKIAGKLSIAAKQDYFAKK